MFRKILLKFRRSPQPPQSNFYVFFLTKTPVVLLKDFCANRLLLIPRKRRAPLCRNHICREIQQSHFPSDTALLEPTKPPSTRLRDMKIDCGLAKLSILIRQAFRVSYFSN